MPRSNYEHPENWRPGFKGEKHPPMRTPVGWRRGNYLGPGTHAVERLRRGDKPINFSDTVAQAHDLRYASAKGPDDVRIADRLMIAKLTEGQDRQLDYPVNLLIGKKGIEAKVGLENLGLSRTAFTTFGSMDQQSKAIVEQKLGELERRGFGLGKKRNPWLEHVAAFRQLNPRMSYKEVLVEARKTYTPKR